MTAKMNMGRDRISIVYVAEIYGIKLALRLMIDKQAQEPETDGVVILTSNQAAIKILEIPL
jgi:hypothetical protein